MDQQSGSSAAAKTAYAAGEQLPPYNPADFKPGEGYVRGSQSGGVPGQIVLVDEEDGSVIGELGDGFQIVEDSKLKPGSKGMSAFGCLAAIAIEYLLTVSRPRRNHPPN